MPKIIISGCNGRMGQQVTAICKEKGVQIAAGFDIYAEKKNDYPVYADPMEFGGSADALVDFRTDIA